MKTVDALWQRRRRLFSREGQYTLLPEYTLNLSPTWILMNATFKAQHNGMKNEHFNISYNVFVLFMFWMLIWMLWTFPLLTMSGVIKDMTSKKSPVAPCLLTRKSRDVGWIRNFQLFPPRWRRGGMCVYALFWGVKVEQYFRQQRSVSRSYKLYMKVYKLLVYRFVKQDKSNNQLFALVIITRLVVLRNRPPLWRKRCFHFIEHKVRVSTPVFIV